MVAFRNPKALGKVAQPKQDNSKKGEFLRRRCERVKSTCGRRNPAVKRARLSLYVYISGEEVRFPGPPGARWSVTPLTKNNSGSQPFRTVFWPRLRKTPPIRPKTVPGLLRDAPGKPQTIEFMYVPEVNMHNFAVAAKTLAGHPMALRHPTPCQEVLKWAPRPSQNSPPSMP